jgi:hypothetical protein
MISALICASVNLRGALSATACGTAIASDAKTPNITMQFATATLLLTCPPVIRQWSITQGGFDKARAQVERCLVRVCATPSYLEDLVQHSLHAARF